MIGLALKLLGWGKALGNAALALVTSWPWQTACAALACLAAWCWQGWSAEQDARRAERAKWATADAINRTSINTLLTAIADQSNAVRAWADTADRRQKAAQAALARAEKQGEALEALALRIERERAQRPPQGKCETPRAVLDARGEL